MDRPFSQRVAGLALVCGLALASGCGYHDRGLAAAASEAQQETLAPPQPFAAHEARPIPSPVLVTEQRAAIPVQAQFAQPESPPAQARGGSVYAPAPGQQRPAETRVAIAPQTAEPPQPQVNPAVSSTAVSQPISDQVDALNRRAVQMAQKGMLFAARNELIQALQLFAQSLDVRHGGTAHSTALAAGLTALREAEDFSLELGRDPAGIRVGDIARSHKTALLHVVGDVSPVVAQQQYFTFAQQQLAISVAGDPAASRSLYTLGKIQTALPGAAGPDSSLAGPRAMVWFQAALAADPRNHLAANELGVLLARYGQLPGARQALLHSISVQPQVETWHNLAVVHQRLGEAELARLAENERRLLAQRDPRPAHAAENRITWVDAGEFAASGGKEPGTPVSTAAQPTTNTRR
jgi:tetratricopeptide (TPR) repeat protein